MRYWKVEVKPGNGDPFWCRALEMTGKLLWFSLLALAYNY